MEQFPISWLLMIFTFEALNPLHIAGVPFRERFCALSFSSSAFDLLRRGDQLRPHEQVTSWYSRFVVLRPCKPFIDSGLFDGVSSLKRRYDARRSLPCSMLSLATILLPQTSGRELACLD